MRRQLAYLWRRHRLALAAFVLAAAVTLFFLGRLVVSAVYWADPAHRDVMPQGWMTPRYVARSWGVAPEELRAMMNLDAQGRPQTLRDIAAARGVPVAQVLDEVRAHVESLRAGTATPGPGP